MANLLVRKECRICNMKFDSHQQLVNHTKNFCAGSAYSDLEKLERKHKEELVLQNPAKYKVENPQEFFMKQKRNQMSTIGLMSVQDVKNILEQQEDSFTQQKLVQIAQRNKEEELINELNSIKERRSHLWELQRKGETLMIELKGFYLQKEQAELEASVQYEMINRLKADLEKYQIMTEYIAQLQNLLQQSKQNTKKQKDLYEDIQQREKGLEEDEKRNKNLDEMYLQERNERIQDLMERMRNIDKQKNFIQEKYDFIKDKYDSFLNEKEKQDKKFMKQQLQQAQAAEQRNNTFSNPQYYDKNDYNGNNQQIQQQQYNNFNPNQQYNQQYQQQQNQYQFSQLNSNTDRYNQNQYKQRKPHSSSNKNSFQLQNVGYYYVQGNQPIFGPLHNSHVNIVPQHQNKDLVGIDLQNQNNWNKLYKYPDY